MPNGSTMPPRFAARLCITNVNGIRSSQRARRSAAAESGSITTSAMSLVANRESASVAPVRENTAARRVANRDESASAAASSMPALRMAPATARMPNRHASVLAST